MRTSDTEGRGFLLQITREDGDAGLAEIIEGSRQRIAELLLQFGVILFRGYGVNRADELRRVAYAFSKNLLDYNERAAPRTEVRDKVYTSTEFPKEETIPLHHEMSYSYNYPRYLYFCCSIASETGGVTPVADDRAVLDKMPKRIRETFETKKLMYIRNFGTGVDMPWQTAFQTSVKADVERYLSANRVSFTWHSDKWLETRFVADPIVAHPLSGEPFWFNHAHLFHSSNLPGEVREALVEELTEHGLPRNVFYGDGSTIEDDDLETIRQLYAAHGVEEPWERGDFMLIDNMRAVHGRTPYRGAREIYVCMSDLLTRDNQRGGT